MGCAGRASVCRASAVFAGIPSIHWPQYLVVLQAEAPPSGERECVRGARMVWAVRVAAGSGEEGRCMSGSQPQGAGAPPATLPNGAALPEQTSDFAAQV